MTEADLEGRLANTTLELGLMIAELKKKTGLTDEQVADLLKP